ncbi:hypothetical protein A1O7_06820 [Cladophialophora yegresii CBS 114405]|uniref:Uncharacterized protein n=1 Tax=Cladophialophora yegresii CBS 114405 TaxID=1182544 RepID=W9VW76_9EURO|nr:uncharacterized protein A1O7_06820 [Cladophialophora yegresii CBS 114405]EXJ56476.1 hypothetical protein A1O7_06820 [Cladophialophora yegresii CBS 114405]
MSDRFRGYDDEYGYKSRDRVSGGNPEYYRKEKKYHDDDYHEDRERQRTRYNEGSETFERGSTKGIKKEYEQLWPKSGAPRSSRTTSEPSGPGSTTPRRAAIVKINNEETRLGTTATLTGIVVRIVL